MQARANVKRNQSMSIYKILFILVFLGLSLASYGYGGLSTACSNFFGCFGIEVSQDGKEIRYNDGVGDTSNWVDLRQGGVGKVDGIPFFEIQNGQFYLWGSDEYEAAPWWNSVPIGIWINLCGQGETSEIEYFSDPDAGTYWGQYIIKVNNGEITACYNSFYANDISDCGPPVQFDYNYACIKITCPKGYTYNTYDNLCEANPNYSFTPYNTCPSDPTFGGKCQLTGVQKYDSGCKYFNDIRVCRDWWREAFTYACQKQANPLLKNFEGQKYCRLVNECVSWQDVPLQGGNISCRVYADTNRPGCEYNPNLPHCQTDDCGDLREKCTYVTAIPFGDLPDQKNGTPSGKNLWTLVYSCPGSVRKVCTKYQQVEVCDGSGTSFPIESGTTSSGSEISPSSGSGITSYPGRTGIINGPFGSSPINNPSGNGFLRIRRVEK